MNNYIAFNIPFTAAFHLSYKMNKTLTMKEFVDPVRPLLKEYGRFNGKQIEFKWLKKLVLFEGKESLGVLLYCEVSIGAFHWKDFNEHCLSLVKQIAKFTNQEMVTYDPLINPYKKIEIGNPNIHYYK